MLDVSEVQLNLHFVLSLCPSAVLALGPVVDSVLDVASTKTCFKFVGTLVLWQFGDKELGGGFLQTAMFCTQMRQCWSGLVLGVLNTQNRLVDSGDGFSQDRGINRRMLDPPTVGPNFAL